MNIPTYNLFRTRITEEKRDLHPATKPEDTHLISIDCMINGDRWSANVDSIEPWQLKAVVNMMKDNIINSANNYYKETVVTSIG